MIGGTDSEMAPNVVDPLKLFNSMFSNNDLLLWLFCLFLCSVPLRFGISSIFITVLKCCFCYVINTLIKNCEGSFSKQNQANTSQL